MDAIYKEMDATLMDTFDKATENFKNDLDGTGILSDPDSNMDGNEDADPELDNSDLLDDEGESPGGS